MPKEIYKTVEISWKELDQILTDYLRDKGFINESWKFEELNDDCNDGYSVTLSRNEVAE